MNAIQESPFQLETVRMSYIYILVIDSMTYMDHIILATRENVKKKKNEIRWQSKTIHKHSFLQTNKDKNEERLINYENSPTFERGREAVINGRHRKGYKTGTLGRDTKNEYLSRCVIILTERVPRCKNVYTIIYTIPPYYKI